MAKIEIFKAGELMTIAQGVFSAYYVNGLFKVLVEFDAQELLIKWAKETGREINDGVVPPDCKNKNLEYLGWLNKKGYIEDVDYRELHIGSYNETKLS